MCKRRKVTITDDPEPDVWQHGGDNNHGNNHGGDSSADEEMCCCTCCVSCGQTTLDRIKVILLILGVILGVALGVGLRHVPGMRDDSDVPGNPGNRERWLMYLKLPSDLLVSLTMLATIPTAITALISGITALRPQAVGRLSLQTLLYQASTCLLATIVAVCSYYVMLLIVTTWYSDVITIQPVRDNNRTDMTSKINVTYTTDFFIDVLRNLFPDNFVRAWLSIKRTQVTTPDTRVGNESHLTEYFSFTTISGPNYAGLVMVSVLVAMVTTKQPSMVQQFIQHCFSAFYHVMAALIQAILWVYPICLVSLLAYQVVGVSTYIQIEALAVFVLTVMAAMFVHFMVTLPVILAAITRKNPYRYMFHVSRALFVAFCTGNSCVTIPTSLSCLDKAGVRRTVSRFVVPIGAHINLDGAALCEPLLLLFVVNQQGWNLGVGQTIAFCLLVIAFTFAAPSLHTAGYVTLGLCLGLPQESFVELIAVNWLTTRLRALVSVWSDMTACSVLERFSSASILQRTSSLPRHRQHHPNITTTQLQDVQLVGARTPLVERSQYTMTVENEDGDRIKVSKV